MEENPTTIKQRISKPMTDGDLEKYTGVKKEDIIKYSDLKNYPKITDLLPEQKDFRIILIEDKHNSGHWVCILRDGKKIEYWNSYGCRPDYEWRFIPRMMRVCLGQEENEMTRLLDQAESDGFTTSYNKYRFQKLANAVQTCGRWVIFRIECFKMGFNNEQFKELVERLKKSVEEEISGGVSADYIVSKYVKG
nr:MAG: putative cysteine protease [Lake Baikal virophage 8]